MTEETCGHPGCTCKAGENGFCSEYCATHPEPEGDGTQQCGCGHGSCEHAVTEE
jgi:hypothetical protein